MEENIKVTANKKMPVPKKRTTTTSATAQTEKSAKKNTLHGIMTAFVDRIVQAVDNGEYTLKRRDPQIHNDPQWTYCTLIIDGMEIECSTHSEYKIMSWHPHLTLEKSFLKLIESEFKGKRERKLVMEAEELD